MEEKDALKKKRTIKNRLNNTKFRIQRMTLLMREIMRM